MGSTYFIVPNLFAVSRILISYPLFICHNELILFLVVTPLVVSMKRNLALTLFFHYFHFYDHTSYIIFFHRLSFFFLASLCISLVYLRVPEGGRPLGVVSEWRVLLSHFVL